MRATSLCWHSAVWRFPPHLLNAFTNSRALCRLEPSWTQKHSSRKKKEISSFCWHVMCRRSRPWAMPLLSFSPLPPFHSLCVGISAPPHHPLHLQTATGLPPATQKPAHAQLFRNEPLLRPTPETGFLSTPNRMSTFFFGSGGAVEGAGGLGQGGRGGVGGVSGWGGGAGTTEVWRDCLFFFRTW